MGPPSQVKPRLAGERLRTPRSSFNKTSMSFESLAEGFSKPLRRSKNKRQSPPTSPSGSSINVPATRLDRRMKAAQSTRTRDNVAHSRVNHHQLLLGNWNILTLTGKELELVEEAKQYHLVLSKFLQPDDVALELWILMADGNSSILVPILISLLKQVRGFSQAPICQTVCQIGFLWDHGSVC